MKLEAGFLKRFEGIKAHAKEIYRRLEEFEERQIQAHLNVFARSMIDKTRRQ